MKKDIATLADEKLVSNDKYKNKIIVFYQGGGFYRFNIPNSTGTSGARGTTQLIKTLKALNLHVNHVSNGYLLSGKTLLKIASA